MAEFVVSTCTSSGLTTATTAYSVNDQAGAIMEMTGVVASSGDEALLTSITLLDKSALVNSIDVYFFDRSITVASDNAAASFADADVDDYVGQVVMSFNPGYKHETAANSQFTVSGLSHVVKPGNSGTSLFVALVITQALDSPGYFASATDVQVTGGFIRP